MRTSFFFYFNNKTRTIFHMAIDETVEGRIFSRFSYCCHSIVRMRCGDTRSNWFFLFRYIVLCVNVNDLAWKINGTLEICIESILLWSFNGIRFQQACMHLSSVMNLIIIFYTADSTLRIYFVFGFFNENFRENFYLIFLFYLVCCSTRTISESIMRILDSK